MTITPPTSPRWTVSDSTRASIDAVFAGFTNTTPGVAMAIYRGGEIAYANGYGMSNLEHNVPITPSSIFHVASISKQFTAMCIALLQDDGLLDVDDPVQKYIPELPTYEYPITIRHLIHHASGIRDHWMLLDLSGWREDDLVTMADCYDLVRRQQELNFTPNDRFMYSNAGYMLLAMIVEKVSGKSLREFAHERIFAPLGMTRTHFHDDHSEIVPGRTQAYKPRTGGGYRVSIPQFDVVGTTSLQTTVEDFAKWNAIFESPTICSAEMLAQAQTPGTFNSGEPMAYGWGLFLEEWCGQRRVWHSVSNHGYRAYYFRLPNLDFGITVFANLSTVAPDQLAARVARIVLGDLLQEDSDAEISTTEHSDIVMVDPAAMVGVYLADNPTDNEPPLHVQLDEEDSELIMPFGRESVSLPLADDGRFQLWSGFGSCWAMEIDDSGIVQKICVQLPATRETYSRLDTSSARRNITSFAGTYYAPELDISIQLVEDATSGRLSWRQRKQEDRSVVLLDTNTLGMGSLDASIRLEFSFDENDMPTEFRFSADRVKNLLFVRQ